MAENGFEVRYHDKFVKWRRKLKDKAAKLRIADRIKRVEVHGFFGDRRCFSDDVWEMRVDCGPGYRIYYTQRGEKIVMLLCGGNKSTQARDIKLAKKLAKEVKMGGWDKYQKFDIIDWLEDEEDCAEYIKIQYEEGRSAEDIERAYRDCERARLVHGFGPGVPDNPRTVQAGEPAAVTV